MKRNLHYFVCPLREAWKWNIERLKSYWKIFNGKKVVSIVQGDGLAGASEVTAMFPDDDIEFIVSENSPVLCETKTYISGFSRLQSSDPDEITFYAHAKGVRHEGNDLLLVKRWTDSLYLLNLGSTELVDLLMSRYGTIGCYRQVVPYGGSEWHFSGSFYWMRNRDIFSRNWKDIEPLKFGSEGYPGRHFKVDESFSLTPEVLPHILYGNPPAEAEYRGWFDELRSKYL